MTCSCCGGCVQTASTDLAVTARRAESSGAERRADLGCPVAGSADGRVPMRACDAQKSRRAAAADHGQRPSMVTPASINASSPSANPNATPSSTATTRSAPRGVGGHAEEDAARVRHRCAASARRTDRAGRSASRTQASLLDAASGRGHIGVAGAAQRPSRAQLAALSMTDIWCQRPGNAWQNACAARAGFGQEAVRRDEDHARRAERQERLPGRSRRRPTALAALSPPPPATSTRGMPERRGRTGGQRSGRLRVPSTSAACAARRGPVPRASRRTSRAGATSSHSVPDGIGHVADLLAGQAQAQVVLGQQHVRTRANTSGSCLRTHSSFGAVKPGIARLPVMLADCGLAGFQFRALAPRCGRRSTGSPGAAGGRRVEQHRRRASGPPGRSRGPAAAIRGSPPMAATVAPHQRCGSCSDHSHE